MSRTTGGFFFPESLWVIYTMTEPKCTTEDSKWVKNDTSSDRSPSTLTHPEEVGEGGGEGDGDDGDDDDVKVNVCAL